MLKRRDSRDRQASRSKRRTGLMPATLSGPAIWSLVKKSWHKWNDDPVPRFAAALAFYTTFAMIPMVVLIVMISAGLFGDDAMRNHLHRQMGDIIGRLSADGLFALIDHWRGLGSPILNLMVALVLFVIAAARVMDQLQDALDCIWGLKRRRPAGLLGRFQQKCFSLFGLLGIVFVLLVSMMASALLSIGAESLVGTSGGESSLFSAMAAVVSYVVIAFLFGLIFKFVPQAQVAWADVWMGAILTALLFVAGSMVIVFYLGSSALVTFYGEAGSLVVILLWAYYASQIFLFGAVFIAVYAGEHGSDVRPAGGAVAVRPAAESD
jgi:membrane protein